MPLSELTSLRSSVPLRHETSQLRVPRQGGLTISRVGRRVPRLLGGLYSRLLVLVILPLRPILLVIVRGIELLSFPLRIGALLI
jgi:hypothetical protein